jgi:ribose 5-phosphate isomerase B
MRQASTKYEQKTIAVAADHAGFDLKERVKEYLQELGHEVIDCGTNKPTRMDYPEVAIPAAQLVAGKEADAGVLFCGSGNGVAIAANKVYGVRAINAHDADEAAMARRHNKVNVISLSGDRLSISRAKPIVAAFLSTEFDGGRHARRIRKIKEVER